VSNWVRIYVQVVKISLEVSIGEEDGTAKNQGYPWPYSTLLLASFSHFHAPLLRLCVVENILISVVDPDPHGYALIWLSWIRNSIRNADSDLGAWNRPN
jgi:hypothetical protein